MRTSIAIVAALMATMMLAACSNTPSDLTGKQWQLTAITEKVPAYQGVVPAEDQGRYTITFNTDGTFNAKADCNIVAGTFKTSGTSLTITLGPSTLVACPDGSYGDLFAHALSRAETYAVSGSDLTIELQDGGILSFAEAVAGASASAAAEATATPTPTPAPTASPTPTADAHAQADGVTDADTKADRQAERLREADRHAGADPDAHAEAHADSDAQADPGPRRGSGRPDVAIERHHREGAGVPGRGPGGGSLQVHAWSSPRTGPSRQSPTATTSPEPGPPAPAGSST